MFELRPYQKETIKKVLISMKHGNRCIIVQQPPRTGKTVIFSEIARRTTLKKNRVLFLVHRREILDQTITTFKKQKVDLNLTTLGMVQTLTRHIENIPEPRLIIVDEGHRALAKSYQRILNQFPKAIVLLFTATPHRTGRTQLDQIADDIIVGQSIHELTDKGFLAPFRYFQPPNDFDSKLLKRSSTGDFTNESMQQAMSTKIFGHIVKQYKRIADGMQAVVYTYSIDSAVEIARKFNSEGISAIEVDGMTPKEKRAVAAKKFREQEIKILVNVNLFTEGVDLPNVDCVIMARPTASLALYLQFSMRCLNPRPGKTAIIIDHANNFKAFGYPDDDRDWKQAIKSGKQKSKSLLKDPGLSIITCDYCFAVVKASEVKGGKCPLCGRLIKVHEAKPFCDVDLVEASKEHQRLIKEIVKNNLLKEVANKTVGELHSLKELQAYAKLHGYKKGWCYYIAKRKGII